MKYTSSIPATSSGIPRAGAIPRAKLVTVDGQRMLELTPDARFLQRATYPVTVDIELSSRQGGISITREDRADLQDLTVPAEDNQQITVSASATTSGITESTSVGETDRCPSHEVNNTNPRTDATQRATLARIPRPGPSSGSAVVPCGCPLSIDPSLSWRSECACLVKDSLSRRATRSGREG
jgi:hypothetical protein